MNAPKSVEREAIARLLSQTSCGGPNGDCLEWTGAVDARGYGCARWNGRTTGAHRAVVLAQGLAIPPGHYVCHRCDNRRCVNPDHLYVGTPSNNVQDAWDRGMPRHRSEAAKAKLGATRRAKALAGTLNLARGTAKANAKLDEEKVRAIRASSAPHTELAALYGVSRHLIRFVRIGKSWPQVSDAKEEGLS